METLDQEILDRFEQLASYNIRQFLNNYLDFVDNHYSNITNYYSSASTVNPTVSFNKLDWLLKERKKIIDVVILNSGALEEDYQFWVLLEHIEDIGHTLETAHNSSKWLRAASTNDGYKLEVLDKYMAKAGEGLEDIERRVLHSDNWRDQWVHTALENELEEEDYTLDGGYLIKVIYKNNTSLFLSGVVDNIDEPLKTYGKDIDKRILFENDDLVVLDYEDTIFQSARILADLKREDDPAYPERGVNVKGILGGSLAAISYPTMFRELAGNFATDDSFKSFAIKDIRGQGDAIFLDFEVGTKAGDVLSQTSQL